MNVKATLSVIVAFVFFLLGWLSLATVLYGIGYVASHAREDMGVIHFLHVLLMWVLGPGFGGFLSTYVTPATLALQLFPNHELGR